MGVFPVLLNWSGWQSVKMNSFWHYSLVATFSGGLRTYTNVFQIYPAQQYHPNQVSKWYRRFHIIPHNQCVTITFGTYGHKMRAFLSSHPAGFPLRGRLKHQNNDINGVVRKASPTAEKKPPVNITGGFS